MRGELAQTAHDTPGAIQAYEQVLALEPDDELTLTRLGALNAMQGNYARALDYTGKLVRAGSNNHALLLLHASILEKLQRNVELVELINRLLRTDPNNTMLLRSRAAAWWRMGMKEMALKEMARLGLPGATTPSVSIVVNAPHPAPPPPVIVPPKAQTN